MHRLLALHANPLDARVLEPLIRREIHFRLLMADHGGMLRELLRIDSHAGRIAKAIRCIQDRFREPLAVPELASLAAMSVSTFHEHFKAVTGNTPLQYQKAIRLIEAQRLLEPIRSQRIERRVRCRAMKARPSSAGNMPASSAYRRARNASRRSPPSVKASVGVQQ
jgi:AraC-like DNA-binding protein